MWQLGGLERARTVWLVAETWTKRWPTVSEWGMPGLPGFNVEEGIPRFREAAVLPWIYHLRPAHPPWEGPKDTPFTRTVGNKSSVIALLCSPDLCGGNCSHWAGTPKWMGVIGCQRGRGHVASLSFQGQGGMLIVMERAAIRICLTRTDLWHQLVDCDVPRTETDKKLTEFWLNLYKQESSRRREQKLNLNHKIWVTGPQWIPRLEPVYKLRTHEAKSPWGRPQSLLTLWAGI